MRRRLMRSPPQLLLPPPSLARRGPLLSSPPLLLLAPLLLLPPPSSLLPPHTSLLPRAPRLPMALLLLQAALKRPPTPPLLNALLLRALLLRATPGGTAWGVESNAEEREARGGLPQGEGAE